MRVPLFYENSNESAPRSMELRQKRSISCRTETLPLQSVERIGCSAERYNIYIYTYIWTIRLGWEIPILIYLFDHLCSIGVVEILRPKVKILRDELLMYC